MPWPARGPLGRLRQACQGPGGAWTDATTEAGPQEDYAVTRVKLDGAHNNKNMGAPGNSAKEDQAEFIFVDLVGCDGYLRVFVDKAAAKFGDREVTVADSIEDR